MPNNWNPYSNMKSKQKTNYLNITYFSNMLETLISMFEYKGLPETVDTSFLEQYLIAEGVASIAKTNSGDWIAVRGGLAGNINPYGLGTDFVGAWVGDSKTWKIGDNCVLVQNNNIRCPDWQILQFADLLAEIDKSSYSNLKRSRLNPIGVAPTESVRKALSDAMENSDNGAYKTIMSSNLFDGEQPVYTIDLNRVQDIQYLQYLSQFYDMIQKRFYATYGHNMNLTAFNSQSLKDELHGADSTCWIVPLDRLEQRKKAIEKFNEISGMNASVDFSEVWKTEYTIYKNHSVSHETDVSRETTEEGAENDVGTDKND